MLKLISGVIVVAAIATFGDFIWYHFGVRHQMTVGVLHGAMLLMAAGGALGWPGGRLVTGLVMGIASGVAGALAYYALVGSIGQSAMLAAWCGVWLLLAASEGRLVQKPARPWTRILTSGVLAAVLSGIGFYAISGIVWGHGPANERNYVQHFACWLVAWVPGLLAIGLSPKGSR